MFRVVLWGQWKWVRLFLVLGTLTALAVPVVSVLMALPEQNSPGGPMDLLRATRAWGTVYPLLAAGLGLLIATSAWAPDHRGRHIHALSLPVPRWRYALLRYGAGLVLLVPPVVALLVGCLVTGAIATLPAGLQTYPVALTLRFALAAGVAFSVFFAISAGTTRTAGLILASIILLGVLGTMAPTVGVPEEPVAKLFTALFADTGPFGVFTGRWMLVDV